MRLIDADAINPMRCPRSIKEMREWIDNIPTAYDIDKVVEQLEEEKECGFDMVDIDYAIEIVKGGAV